VFPLFDIPRRLCVFSILAKGKCSGNAKKLLRMRHGHQVGPTYLEIGATMMTMPIKRYASWATLFVIINNKIPFGSSWSKISIL